MLRKFVKVLVGILLLGFVLDKAGETAKQYFDIKSIQSRVKKDFAFIQVKYKCNLKSVENAELRIYSLLKKGSREKVAFGKFDLNEIEKGYYKETFMISASYVKEYGKPRKFRVEIWYKDRLRATKTKPGAKKKWWEKDSMNIITRSDKQLEKLLRDYEDDDD